MTAVPVKTLLLSFQGRCSRKNYCLGQRGGGFECHRGGGKNGGGGWVERQRRWDMDSTQTNPGCLFVPSPIPTSPFCAPIPLFCKQHCSGSKIAEARTYAFVSISDPDWRYSENINWMTVFHHVLFFLTPLTSCFSPSIMGIIILPVRLYKNWKCTYMHYHKHRYITWI